MQSTRYPEVEVEAEAEAVAVAVAAEQVVPIKATLSPFQSVGVFVSHLVAVAALAALGTAVVTVALFVFVVLAPVLVLVFVHLVRRHDRLRLGGAAV